MDTKSFADLKLSPEALHALDKAGFEHPTPIQAQAIPPALEGRDVIGTAATGTGKTAAFLLPIIERLAGKTGTRALILAPTRELALQIGEELERFGHGRHVRGAVVIGGVGMGAQTEALRRRPEVIIATPGRLVDHLQQRTASPRRHRGARPRRGRPDARHGVQAPARPHPRARATEAADAALLRDDGGRGGRVRSRPPARTRSASRSRAAARPPRAPSSRSSSPARRRSSPLLLALLARDDVSTLVFTRTKRRADKVWKALGRAGHKVARIHADRSQAQRRMALDGFKDGTYRVLVATDIAARGIDVAEIGHVVNFDLPHVPEDYVHRVGRTARAAASGRASTFSAPEERELLARHRAAHPGGHPPRRGAARRRGLPGGDEAEAGGARVRPGAAPIPAGARTRAAAARCLLSLGRHARQRPAERRRRGRRLPGKAAARGLLGVEAPEVAGRGDPPHARAP